MSTAATETEPFVSYARATVTEARPARVVVEQPAAPELDNHVGVRHASALHSAGYEASRALVAAAAGGIWEGQIRLEQSEIEYVAVGLGKLTTCAEPTGDGWDRLSTEPAEALARLTLTASVTTTNEEGKVVARLELSWTLSASGR